MKTSRLYWSLSLLLFIGVGKLFGQTIVSTQPTNKTALLEEFGGMYCVYCPQGHAVTAQLVDDYPEQFIPINYQVGSYAEPIGNDLDLRSDHAGPILEMTDLTGYPAAAVNRHQFPGLEQYSGGLAMGRDDWPEAVAEAITAPAPVNIAAEATLNIATRELTIYLEYYYTETVNLDQNRLHIAVLQNNVLAPQHGSNQGNFYAHQHLFREYLTGQWGQILENTDVGTFGSLTYSLTLPEFYRDVWLDPVEVELAIFITEDEEEVLNSIAVQPELHSSYADDVRLVALIAPEDICDPYLDAQLWVRNEGNETLNNFTIHYAVDGQTEQSFEWEGELGFLDTTCIHLSGLSADVFVDEHFLAANLMAPNGTPDPTEYNNTRVHTFTVAPYAPTNLFEMVIRTDFFGYEFYWEVVDEAGEIYASGGNEVVGATNGGEQIAFPDDPNVYENESFYVEEFFLPVENCYTLRVLDDYGDGICCSFGNGFYRLRPQGEDPILEGGAFGALKEHHFQVGTGPTTTSSTENNTIVTETVLLAPNPLPAGGTLYLQWSNTPPSSYLWQLHDTNGQRLQQGDQRALPATQALPAGYYVIQLQTPTAIHTLPLIIQP